ncbi:cytochrome c family protein [Acidocella sp.]|uniref:c-type cytochrome n=1 Tax=Acidocella sp. TaxID=50710 RepID=UPI002617ADF9|nr:c-type cytochrome [Acidocella sp.]
MKFRLTLFTVLLAGATGFGVAHAAGSASAGQAVYSSQCALCHSNQPGGVGIGPSLAGVYGQPAAAQGNYDYSSAMKNSHLTWNDATLNKFLAAPQATVPGTKMPYAGLTDAGQRADVIAYLASIAGK